LIDTALAATIHGTVYNLDLEKQENTIVTADSTPLQTLVSKDGAYSFELGTGDYKIEAKYYENEELISKASESVSIKEQGDYIVDLILFPSFAEEEELLSETDLEVVDPLEEANYTNYIIISIIVALAAATGIFVYFKYKKLLNKIKKDIEETLQSKEAAAESRKVIDFIKEQNGRTTQKEIRAKFPSSEAKISLIISELESKGLVKKIKKGRGNIIVLK
jgi:uncharacterized membrane protein